MQSSKSFARLMTAFTALSMLLLPGCAWFQQGSESPHSEQVAKAAQCFWMENYSGKFEWVPANAVYQTVLTQGQCFALDSCDGGAGESGGGCYKWAVAADAPRIPWPRQ